MTQSTGFTVTGGAIGGAIKGMTLGVMISTPDYNQIFWVFCYGIIGAAGGIITNAIYNHFNKKVSKNKNK